MNTEERYLCCVVCKSDLKKVKTGFECKKCKNVYSFKNGIFDCLKENDDEKLFSRKKWDKFYDNWFGDKNFTVEYNKVKSNYQKYGVDQIKKYASFSKETVYFELGCGTFIIGGLVGSQCKVVIGIDFSLPALLTAKKVLDKQGVKNYILIRGDIFNIPIKNDVVDILYGGGVIEHFKDTGGCIKEFGRIMKKGGVALNAVPMLNIGSLTYPQIWGNIPDFPILKQLAEIIHIKLLGGKHMYFGYELSFTQNKLFKLHQQSGFSDVKFTRLETDVMMGFFPKFIRPMMIYLAENSSWFWPMMLVVAKK